MYTEEKLPIDEVIKHYGVQGMQRGIRKDPNAGQQMNTHARVMLAKRLAQEMQRRADSMSSESQAQALSTSAKTTSSLADQAGDKQVGQGWGAAARLAALLMRRQNMNGDLDKEGLDSGAVTQLQGSDLKSYESSLRQRLKQNPGDNTALKYFSKMYPDVTVEELTDLKHPIYSKQSAAKQKAEAKTTAAKQVVAKASTKVAPRVSATSAAAAKKQVGIKPDTVKNPVLKPNTLRTLEKSPEIKAQHDKILNKLWDGKLSRTDAEFLLKYDPNLNDGSKPRPKDSEMRQRLRRNPNDQVALEYLFT